MPKIEIIAHRGASRERPENTVAAFVRAVELGADGIELDVHLTADDVLVVHHDTRPHEAPSERLANRDIRSLTSGELDAFRVRGERIPTLKQVIDAVAGKLRIYCELKGADTALPALQLLGKLGAAAAVHAFDHRQIAASRAIAPAFSRGVLEASYHVVPTDTMVSVDARDLWMAAEMIDRVMVDAVHGRGGRVIAWTVDSADEMRRLESIGVDGLCTNDVALCRSALGL
jgi:glycerophosphoryl diester phosphodiesterase